MDCGPYVGLSNGRPLVSLSSELVFQWCALSWEVEAPITDHLWDFAPSMEKHEVVQFFSISEDKKHEDWNFD